MVRHAKMKQKTSKTTALNVHVTSARLDDSTKDDEERRLESVLFGVKYAPGGNGKGKEKAIELDDEDEEEITAQADGGRTVAHLEDADLFLADDGVDNDVPITERRCRTMITTRKVQKAVPLKLSRPSRTNPGVLLKGPSRTSETAPSSGRGCDLRRQFESVKSYPDETPTTRLRTRTTYLRRSSNHVFADTRRKGKKGEVKLPKDTFSIERLRDVNQATQNSGNGEVRVESFHPNPAASTLCVATAEYDYSTSMDIFRLR
ncbi:hypothetical protein DFP72DRAFT_1142338 [Ephemerocybe angulata]|uniref:Uncharacterized protein n=1 Tax=Ephemerocybe angulata TaxID=980116 RepID=A0A8H6M285_9AGAR|nr:hypothetical protein DFP72DRAFT_1142338 [Tulosesus angulatus]